MKLHNVLPQHIHIIKEEWIMLKAEIDGAIEGEDEQLVEGYSVYNKNQLKNMSELNFQTLTSSFPLIQYTNSDTTIPKITV